MGLKRKKNLTQKIQEEQKQKNLLENLEKKQSNLGDFINLECSFRLYYSRYQRIKFLQSHPSINHSSSKQRIFQYHLMIGVFDWRVINSVVINLTGFIDNCAR